MRLHALRLLILGGVGLIASGCAGSSDDRLVVATNWPDSACDDLEQTLASSSTPIGILWIRVGPNEDPARAVMGPATVDVILGGPAASYEQMRISGRLETLPRGWRVATLGTAEASDSMFALMKARERPGEWAAVFGGLVRSDEPVGSTRQITPSAAGSAAIVSGTPRLGSSLAMLEALGGSWVREESPSLPIVGDLLAATLVDAGQERIAAIRALERAGNPPRSMALFAEAPPWPPASIAKMQARGDGASLVALLAEQVAPEPLAREWLLESWNRSTRPVDGVLLDTLARAADGRLVAEPRFRAWLRSEWSTWARQRYRRVVTRLDNPRYGPP